MVARKKSVQTSAASNGSAQPASKARTQVRGVTDRRRLSTIFQRPLAGIFAGRRLAFPRSALQPEDPGQQLPVAARPAMVAQRGDVVASRIGFDDLDVGGKAGAGEHAFEQIVAEQRGVRNPVGEHGLEGIDRVDALAGIGTFAEQILIDVGNGGGIRIDAVGAGEYALIGEPSSPTGRFGVTRGWRIA